MPTGRYYYTKFSKITVFKAESQYPCLKAHISEFEGQPVDCVLRIAEELQDRIKEGDTFNYVKYEEYKKGVDAFILITDLDNVEVKPGDFENPLRKILY
jgi:hypothetical protein